MSAQAVPRMTPEQYLEADRAAEFKSEYYGGRMYAMSGGTVSHSVIICNLAAELRQALKTRDCIVCPTEVRIRVSPTGLYTYPDIAVICGEAAYADDQRDTILNPIVILEVLSKSTEAHDRGFKFGQYRKLDSLREYILVSQTEPHVEIFRRHSPYQWIMTECAGLEAVCQSEILECEIPLREIYAKIPFEGAPER